MTSPCVCHQGSGIGRKGPGRGEDHTASPSALPAWLISGQILPPSVHPQASGPGSSISHLHDPMWVTASPVSCLKPPGRHSHIPVPFQRASRPLRVHSVCAAVTWLTPVLSTGGGLLTNRPRLRTFPSDSFVPSVHCRGEGAGWRPVQAGLAHYQLCDLH